jgi:pimeloyl-ACP methyl ester carboxylesterase
MSDFQGSYAHLADGRPIYYFEKGTGPPFLYSHASVGSADSAQGMFEQLHDRFHCIALDRAGYRHSGRLDRLTTMEEQVEAIAVVHRACTAEPAWVFGHSGGGNWALAYAVAHPDLVRGLVLMEPALHAVFPPGDRPPGVATIVETVSPLFRAGRLPEAIAAFLGVLHPDLSPKELDEQVTGILASNGRAGWESLPTEMPAIVSWCPTPTEWIRITQPALLMKGDRSWEWIQELAARVAELLPRGELWTLEGLDHGAPGRAPDVVAAKIVEFIDRVGAAHSSL